MKNHTEGEFPAKNSTQKENDNKFKRVRYTANYTLGTDRKPKRAIDW